MPNARMLRASPNKGCPRANDPPPTSVHKLNTLGRRLFRILRQVLSNSCLKRPATPQLPISRSELPVSAESVDIPNYRRCLQSIAHALLPNKIIKRPTKRDIKCACCLDRSVCEISNNRYIFGASVLYHDVTTRTRRGKSVTIVFVPRTVERLSNKCLCFISSRLVHNSYDWADQWTKAAF